MATGQGRNSVPLCSGEEAQLRFRSTQGGLQRESGDAGSREALPDLGGGKGASVAKGRRARKVEESHGPRHFRRRRRTNGAVKFDKRIGVGHSASPRGSSGKAFLGSDH